MTVSMPGLLEIPPTPSSPQVRADPERGLLCLSGESYPENSFEFYRPVGEWVTAFLAQGDQGLTLEVRLSYLNTSSIKCLIDLLDEMEAAQRSGRAMALDWYYDPEDDRAMELAEEFKEDLTLPFRIVPLHREG